MGEQPGGRRVNCPECDKEAIAIVPEAGELVEQVENPDGKVWVNCSYCGERFLKYYRMR